MIQMMDCAQTDLLHLPCRHKHKKPIRQRATAVRITAIDSSQQRPPLKHRERRFFNLSRAN